MRILVVEDDEATSSLIAAALTQQRYIVDRASDGATGLHLAQLQAYDLIVLDLVLPKLDGMSLCRQLRDQGCQSLILLLTARDTSLDRVTGLDAGADDYVVKPFDLPELMARIRALLRRSNTAQPTTIQWANLCLDPNAHEVMCNNTQLRLTQKEYCILELLLLNPGRAFSRSAILDRLWDIAESPGEDTVTSHIKSLRYKLKAAGVIADPIETIYGLGYRLKRSPLEPTEPQPVPDVTRQQMDQAIARIWNKFKDSFMVQLNLLLQAANALSAATLTPELQQQAKQQAHRLAGSLGTFGYHAASRLAQEIESLLQQPAVPLSQAPHFLDLVGQLQQELQKPLAKLQIPEDAPKQLSSATSTSSMNGAAVARPAPAPAIQMVVLSDNPALLQQLQSLAIAPSQRYESISFELVNPSCLDLENFSPELVLLDLTSPQAIETELSCLASLATHQPVSAVVAVIHQDNLRDRVQAARLGCNAFVHQPITAEQLQEALHRALTPLTTHEARILVVDDDLAILEALVALLSPWGMQVVSLSDPQQFWQTLSQVQPNLLILDIEMPEFSGLDLCRVVRSDTHWGNLPILVLTAHRSTEIVQQVFLAGADDYISKPITEPELLARVLNRLERSQSLRTRTRRS